MWEIIRDNKLNDSEKYELALNFDKVLGLDLDKEEEVEVPEKVKELIEERDMARNEKDWKKADELREKINKEGYIIDDAKGGGRVKKKESKNEKRV